MRVWSIKGNGVCRFVCKTWLGGVGCWNGRNRSWPWRKVKLTYWYLDSEFSPCLFCSCFILDDISISGSLPPANCEGWPRLSRLAPKWVILPPNWTTTNLGLFKMNFQYILARSKICPIWGNVYDRLWGQVWPPWRPGMLNYASKLCQIDTEWDKSLSPSLNELKLILKSRRFLPFGVNLTQFGCII